MAKKVRFAIESDQRIQFVSIEKASGFFMNVAGFWLQDDLARFSQNLASP